MRYPNTNFPFNNKLLKVLSICLPIILQYKNVPYDKNSPESALWNIFTYFNVEVMLSQINKIIMDRQLGWE